MLSVAPKLGPDSALHIHASTVRLAGQAICITGPSGAGKSELALALLGRGADLIADDVTLLKATPAGVLASCPSTIAGRIEVREVGILRSPAAPPTPISLIVDLGQCETHRLPPRRQTQILGFDITVLFKARTPHFSEAIVHYVLHGRED